MKLGKYRRGVVEGSGGIPVEVWRDFKPAQPLFLSVRKTHAASLFLFLPLFHTWVALREHMVWKQGATLETTQGQIDGFFRQLPSKCYLPEVASVGD